MSKKRLALVILAVGVVLGLALGVGIGLVTPEVGRGTFHDVFSAERPADVAHPGSIDRDAFALKYPGNWQVRGGTEDDPDRLFSLDSPGSSFATFAIYDIPTDPAENLQVQLRDFVPREIEVAASEDFMRWGAYAGRGVVLRGRTLAGGMAARLRIFSTSGPERSFVVVEMTFDADLAQVEPGARLIEETFRLKQ